MKNKYTSILLAAVILFSSTALAQKDKDKNTVKKIYVLPVYLTFTGLSSDTALEHNV